MNKKTSTKKNSFISRSSRLVQNPTLPHVNERVWKLRRWLFCEKLTVVHGFLCDMDFDEMVNLTPARINIRLVPGLVCRVCEALEVVKIQQHVCRTMLEKIVKGKDVKEVLNQLHRVLPSPFEILIGPISTLFVDVLELVAFYIRAVKPRSKKRDYQNLFLKLLLRTENCESFKDADKARVIEWRKALKADMETNDTRNKKVSK